MTKSLIPLALLLVGCKAERVKPENFVERKITLVDSSSQKEMCRVALFAPIKFDTLLAWLDLSDFGYVQKCRLTNSKSCLIKESGFLYTDFCRDSIRRMTIEYVATKDWEKVKIDSLLLNRRFEKIMNNSNDCRYPVPIWHHRKIERIWGNDFAVWDYACQTYYSEKPFRQIEATTVTNKCWINFRFECSQDDCSDFPETAYQILNSIQIDTI